MRGIAAGITTIASGCQQRNASLLRRVAACSCFGSCFRCQPALARPLCLSCWRFFFAAVLACVATLLFTSSEERAWILGIIFAS